MGSSHSSPSGSTPEKNGCASNKVTESEPLLQSRDISASTSPSKSFFRVEDVPPDPMDLQPSPLQLHSPLEVSPPGSTLVLDDTPEITNYSPSPAVIADQASDNGYVKPENLELPPSPLIEPESDTILDGQVNSEVNISIPPPEDALLEEMLEENYSERKDPEIPSPPSDSMPDARIAGQHVPQQAPALERLPPIPTPMSTLPPEYSTQEDATAPSDAQPAVVEQPVVEDVGDGSSTISTNNEHEDREPIFDEDYHSDTSNYTASLLSDVKNYTYENGRRYHSYREGHYVLPNDDQEQDRQDLLHHVRNLVLNGALFRAPLGEHVQRVLDIGTGTGIWAIDFADSFPSAEVIGTDLSPIQPSWIPPNLRFLVDDAESQWLFSATRPFDFIHARDLGGAIADWPRLLRQAREHLRPGGWVELQEFEVTLKCDDESMRLAPTLCEFLGRLHQASEAFHRPMNIAEGHRQRLIEAGFEEVRDEIYKVRPAEIGIILPPALTDSSPGP
ncbi:hypothetical protein N7474_003749 [Penicillium riverlandense]|uniref:uncharacterized protein n=1 Tax=Penicillium riverlandense TaxID=1903569 RepID=UPI0025483321|nr:uncharacterized protein N7474_003749 [Penicillium riverlandense]KAJ5818158.1 hypothetical protein N7474_003749 [Penicillium riverlandense]